jgi:hypothetical protein
MRGKRSLFTKRDQARFVNGVTVGIGAVVVALAVYFLWPGLRKKAALDRSLFAITGMNPTRRCATQVGKEKIRIDGVGFTSDCQVFFDQAEAEVLEVLPTRIIVNSPDFYVNRHIQVVVKRDDVVTEPFDFTYDEGPNFTGTDYCVESGGTLVIPGINFDDNTNVALTSAGSNLKDEIKWSVMSETELKLLFPIYDQDLIPNMGYEVQVTVSSALCGGSSSVLVYFMKDSLC